VAEEQTAAAPPPPPTPEQALAAAVADRAPGVRVTGIAAGLLAALRSLPGVGEWTAQLVAMRALAWPDAWPAGDLGVLAALGTRDPKVAQAQAEHWRPWRAYAVIGLWHHLEHSR
jgi:AraC family transcriptional regulator of adaptative response / DNA-3-methyladenine glycosylase II